MKHTEGKLELWTSNSYRRFGIRGGAPICEPIKQNDGHPDLYFRNGGPEGPDARRFVACWNACIGISTEAVEATSFPLATEVCRDRADLVTALRETNNMLQAAMLVVDNHVARGIGMGQVRENAALLARFPKEGAKA